MSTNKRLRLEVLEPRLTLSAVVPFSHLSGALGVAGLAAKAKAAAASPPLQNVVLAPNADAFVEGGAYASNNFGPLPYLAVRQDASASNQCQSYLRFDWSSLGGAVKSAVLRLAPVAHGGSTSKMTLRIRLLADADDGWIEGTGGTNPGPGGPLVWNNKPAGTGLTLTVKGSQLGKPLSLDVTSLVNQGFNANRIATFQIDTLSASGPAAYVSFASRQTAGPAAQPTLAVTSTLPVNQAPTVAVPAVVALGPGGTFVGLGALGADDAGEANLSYTWSVTSLPPGAPAPLFSANGTNAAKSTTAMLWQAGRYGFAVKITDVAGLYTATSVGIVVNSTLSGITVTPDQASMTGGAARQFAATALDQFGRPLAAQPSFTWTATDGTIAADGTFTAPLLGAGPITITATSGAVSGTATVTVSSQFLGLADPQLASLTQTLFLDDGSINRQDMILILQSVVLMDNSVDAAELGDLRTILDNSAVLGMPDYVKVLAGDVINGNPANAMYQGQPLGNLAAGSSAEQLDNLVAKWFYGSDHPLADNYVYQATAGQLFNGEPSYTDMRQGMLGDCYFIATLGSIANSSPAAVEDTFIDNGDNTWTVRFYVNGTADYVTVDNMLPCDDQGLLVFSNMGANYADAGNVLWIALAEKAYAQWNETQSEGRDGRNDYSSIEGGWMDVVGAQVLGHAATDYYFASYHEKQALVAALAANQAVTVGTKSYDSNGLYGNHAYVVTGYDSGTGTFTAYNPWGTDHPGPLTWSQLAASCYVLTVAAT